MAGKSANSLDCSAYDLSEGKVGTGYICRVIYGVVIESNVYFYWYGLAVAAYNGTTENPCDSCVESVYEGTAVWIEMDIEIAVSSIGYYTV